MHLAGLEKLILEEPGRTPEKCLSAVVEGINIFLPLAEMVDLEEELARIRKELEQARRELGRAEKNLRNEGFISKAPPEVVEKERKRQSSTGHRLPAWKRCSRSLKHSHGNDQGTGAFRKPPGAGADRTGLRRPGPSRKGTEVHPYRRYQRQGFCFGLLGLRAPAQRPEGGAVHLPHLEEYAERFQINGELIPAETLRAVVAQAEAACRRVEQQHPELGPVTEFELATAAGFLYFHQAGVDLVVLETGLGAAGCHQRGPSPAHRDHHGSSGSPGSPGNTVAAIAWEKGHYQARCAGDQRAKLPEAQGSCGSWPGPKVHPTSAPGIWTGPWGLGSGRGRLDFPAWAKCRSAFWATIKWRMRPSPFSHQGTERIGL